MGSYSIRIKDERMGSDAPSARINHTTGAALSRRLPETGRIFFSTMRPHIVTAGDPGMQASLVEIKRLLRNEGPIIPKSGPSTMVLTPTLLQVMAHDLRRVINYAVENGKDIIVT